MVMRMTTAAAAAVIVCAAGAVLDLSLDGAFCNVARLVLPVDFGCHCVVACLPAVAAACGIAGAPRAPLAPAAIVVAPCRVGVSCERGGVEECKLDSY